MSSKYRIDNAQQIMTDEEEYHINLEITAVMLLKDLGLDSKNQVHIKIMKDLLGKKPSDKTLTDLRCDWEYNHVQAQEVYYEILNPYNAYLNRMRVTSGNQGMWEI